ncbi:hypothetical protein CLOM_g15870 [Closterium sp. NIES-68]|nr:hypothetical protein CLOM_g15870 [Closterium sp. NIES-68]GJP80985.1 hypothetical protein CLOP_g11174 [Closterium sp. NIES-67]
MRICVLHPSYDGSLSPCNGLDPDAVPQLWLDSPEHHVTSVHLHKATAVKHLIALTRRQPSGGRQLSGPRPPGPLASGQLSFSEAEGLQKGEQPLLVAPPALAQLVLQDEDRDTTSTSSTSSASSAARASNPASRTASASSASSSSTSSSSSTAGEDSTTTRSDPAAPFDVFLNLCDGAWDEDRPGIEVVQALERLNVPFTGADSRCYEPSKEQMKVVAVYHGVRTPPWRVCYDCRDVEEAARVLRMPVIVKHASGYNSVGMTRDSKCGSVEELKTQASLMITSFGSVMVEEFVEGREFTVLVSEDPLAEAAAAAAAAAAAEQKSDSDFNSKCRSKSDRSGGVFVYAPVECGFPSGEDFKHFDLKWVEHEGLQWRRVEDEGMDAKLRGMAATMFTALGGVGYGRLDIRADVEGNIYFLEMNPNCGIFYPPDQQGSADFILSLDPSNDHRSFLRRILLAAVHRWERRQPPVLVKQCSSTSATPQDITPSSAAVSAASTAPTTPAVPPKSSHPYSPPSFGLFAARDFTQGDTIELLEEGPVHLVTQQHVEKHWSPQQQLWFRQYAWPVGPGVWAMWSPRAEDWKPLNHSCDPNAWLEGLNVVARRAIGKGEQVTIDYATFCVDSEPFPCSCSSSRCRGKVTGNDYLAPWLAEEYVEHMSAQVLYLRSQAQIAVRGT